MKKLFSIMSILQALFNFKLDLNTVDQHTGGKWLIHSTKTPQGQSVAKPGTPLWIIIVENLNIKILIALEILKKICHDFMYRQVSNIRRTLIDN